MKQLHNSKSSAGARGFTIVELLIVIVVIAMLAAISVVAYRGIQERARDSQRLQDVKTISKALEMYYLDNGEFPPSHCGASCPSPKNVNNSWATTSDGSWSVLEASLVPKYLSHLPKDPSASTDSAPGMWGGFNYDYYALASNTLVCGGYSRGGVYYLTYRMENEGQRRDISGNCPATEPQPGNYDSSEHMVFKH